MSTNFTGINRNANGRTCPSIFLSYLQKGTKYIHGTCETEGGKGGLPHKPLCYITNGTMEETTNSVSAARSAGCEKLLYQRKHPQDTFSKGKIASKEHSWTVNMKTGG